MGLTNRHNDPARNSNISASFFVDGMMLSLGIFGASAYWFVQHTRHRQNLVDDGGSAIADFHKRRQKSLANNMLSSLTNNNQQQQKQHPNERGALSERGRTALVPAIPYLTQLLACFQVSN